MEQCFVVQVTSIVIHNICNVGYNAHTSPLFKQLSIPKLNDIYNTQLCKLMFLFTNGTLPCPIQMVFTRNSNVHSCQTRQAHDPHFVARKSILSQNCLCICSMVQLASCNSCVKCEKIHINTY